jgi:CRISPR-associated exonuclease Cas4
MPEKVSSQTTELDKNGILSNPEARQINNGNRIVNSSQQASEFDDERTPMITTSELIEYLYCPRFTYFLNCLKIPQHEELRYKVLKGRELHEKKEKTNVDYIRKRLGCIKKEVSVYLASKKLKIRGIVDEVLFLNDGTLAPFDYKLTEYDEFIFRTHRVQSTVYAMLIMENYGNPVRRGFICYAKSKNLVKELVYREKDFGATKKIIDEIFAIILEGFYPKKTRWPNRCIDCCYRNICV